MVGKFQERTFIMVKPDGVQRGLVGKIIKRFEARGLQLIGIKFVWPKQEVMEKHYHDLAHLPFFAKFIRYMCSGPVVATVWEGSDAVQIGRQMIGARNATESSPGTIRGMYSLHHSHKDRNVVHGSDAVEAANYEIDLWFTEKELVSWTPAINSWVYD